MTVRRTRIITVQADARRHAAIRDPLGVGVVRWRGLQPRVFAIVNLAFSIAHDRATILDADPPRSATADQFGAEFVAFKPRCDMLLLGHAHASNAKRRIDVGLTFGEFQCAWSALSSEPSLAIPLVSHHLRDAHDGPVDLTPRRGARESKEDSFDAFEHARVQAAPDVMQQAHPTALGETLKLVGLSPRDDERSVEVPRVVPRMWSDHGHRQLEVPLRLDTIAVDTDHESLTVTWRGPLTTAPNRLITSLEDATSPRTLDDVLGDLPRGTVGWAAEEHDDTTGDEAELEMASYEVLEHVAPREMTLQQFAATSARLAEQDKERDEILESLDLDERSWGIEERAWVTHVGERAEAGDGTVAAEFAELFLAAQDALAAPHEPLSLGRYAELKRLLAKAHRPDEVLTQEGICLGEWMRLERHWSDRAADDADVAAELTQLLG